METQDPNFSVFVLLPYFNGTHKLLTEKSIPFMHLIIKLGMK